METQKSTDYSSFIEGILTVSDRDVFLGQLNQLEEDMFKQSFDEVIGSLLPYQQKSSFQQVLHEHKIEHTDLVKIQDIIASIRSFVQSIPVLSITLVKPPREALLRKIMNAVSDQTQQPLFLNVNVDPAILGGSKLEWGGKYQDYSLSKKLEEYFEKRGNL